MLDFKPPKDSPFLIGLVKLILPAVLKVALHDTQVSVVDDGLERFKALRGLRTVICPNHANHDDPEVMFALSKMVHEDFNFLAAREIFDRDHGSRGFWLQRLGCYSIVRGAADRESFKMTRGLIAANKKKLIIFPEGEITRQNDTLLTLESGVCQMSFWALDDLEKQQRPEPVFILPLAVKYTYREEIRNTLEQALYKIEDRIGLKASRSDSLYKRLALVADSLLAALEHEYNFKPRQGDSRNDRIVGLRGAILRNIAGYLQIELPPNMSQLEQVRVLRNAIDDSIFSTTEHEDVTAYQKRLHDEKTTKIKGFYRDLDRVLNFIAIYDGYLREHLKQERFAEVLDRIETEVFGKASVKGARLVLIQVGQPIDLLAAYPEYRSSKKAAVHRITAELSLQISTMLDALNKRQQAVIVD